MKRVVEEEVVTQNLGKNPFWSVLCVFGVVFVGFVFLYKGLFIPSNADYQEGVYFVHNTVANNVLLYSLLLALILAVMVVVSSFTWRRVFKSFISLALVFALGAFMFFSMVVPMIHSGSQVDAHNEEVSISKLETKYDNVRKPTDEEYTLIESSEIFDMGRSLFYYGEDEDGQAYLFQTYVNKVEGKLKVDKKVEVETVTKEAGAKEEF